MNIFSIFTCESHKDRLKALERAWIPKTMPQGSKMYYVYGNAEEPYEDERNLFVSCHESYEYLLDKTYHTLKYILDYDFEYFIKLDNDIYIPSFPSLIKKIDELKSNQIDFATTAFVGESEASRTWHYKKVPEEFKTPYKGLYPKKWGQGHCYIISKEFCQKAFDKLSQTKLHLLPVTEAVEDVVISNIMFENNAKTCEIGEEIVEHLHISTKSLTEKAIAERASRHSTKDASEYELWWQANPDIPSNELFSAEGFEDVLFLFDTSRSRAISRIDLDEAALLWRSIKETTGTVVEIGSRFGGTTCMILMALKGKRKLYSIDTKPLHNPNLFEYMNKCKQQGVFEMLISNSSATPIKDISLLFIDGDNSYEGVIQDIRCHWPNVMNGGLVLFHDGAPDTKLTNHPGVELAIEQLIDSGKAEKLSTVRTMVLVKKICS